MVSQLSFKQKTVFFSVLCFFLGVIGFFSYELGFRQEKIYYIYFDCSVNGLKEGSSVTYKGVEVGLVSEISIDISNVDLVKVAVKLERNFPVYSNYFASLNYKGMAGLYSIDLNKKGSVKDEVKMAPGSSIVYKPTNLEAAFQNIPEVVQETKILLKKMNSYFSEKQIKNISDSVEQLSINLKECSEDLKNMTKYSKKQSMLVFKRLNKNLAIFTKITKKMEKDYFKIQTEVIDKLCAVSDSFKKLITKISDKANVRGGLWKFFC